MSKKAKIEAQKKWTSIVQTEKLVTFYYSIIDDYQKGKLINEPIKA
ncbi:MAG: hypothetical protein O3C08_01010 [Proteobacteria bacterium]|jgi:hypothetical protein|nr:hypothetical protein [Pseudomonadota bacterium]MDA1134393.1 hypothetical protein [Pseudomonadota bacterium]